jgi:hypothetical protein
MDKRKRKLWCSCRKCNGTCEVSHTTWYRHVRQHGLSSRNIPPDVVAPPKPASALEIPEMSGDEPDSDDHIIDSILQSMQSQKLDVTGSLTEEESEEDALLDLDDDEHGEMHNTIINQVGFDVSVHYFTTIVIIRSYCHYLKRKAGTQKTNIHFCMQELFSRQCEFSTGNADGVSFSDCVLKQTVIITYRTTTGIRW